MKSDKDFVNLIIINSYAKYRKSEFTLLNWLNEKLGQITQSARAKHETGEAILMDN